MIDSQWFIAIRKHGLSHNWSERTVLKSNGAELNYWYACKNGAAVSFWLVCILYQSALFYPVFEHSHDGKDSEVLFDYVNPRAIFAQGDAPRWFFIWFFEAIFQTLTSHFSGHIELTKM